MANQNFNQDLYKRYLDGDTLNEDEQLELVLILSQEPKNLPYENKVDGDYNEDEAFERALALSQMKDNDYNGNMDEEEALRWMLMYSEKEAQKHNRNDCSKVICYYNPATIPSGIVARRGKEFEGSGWAPMYYLNANSKK